MAYVNWKLERNAFSNNAWSPTTELLDEYYDVLLDVKAGDGRDSFNFKVTNFNSEYDNYFQPNDKITISRVVNSTTVSTNDVKMVGTIINVPDDNTGTQSLIRVEGYNFSEAIMSSLVFIDLVDKTPPQAIQEALNNVALNNPNFSVTWHPDNLTVNSTGGSFPTFTKRYFYVPLKKIVEEVSSAQFTADGTYNWWVDSQNRFVWKSNALGSTYDFDVATDEHTKIKTGKDTKDVKNFIILKGGRDPAGKPIQTVYQDYTSSNKHGLKFMVAVSNTTVAENLNEQDIPDKNAPSRFPTAYPFTTSWRRIATGLTVTVTNDTEYVQAIRAEVRARLTLEAKEIAELRKYGKLKVDVEFQAGVKTWLLGDKINATIPSLQSTVKQLRVKEIQYSTTMDTFSLEEDVGSL
jgi:hypothetical protein